MDGCEWLLPLAQEHRLPWAAVRQVPSRQHQAGQSLKVL